MRVQYRFITPEIGGGTSSITGDSADSLMSVVWLICRSARVDQTPGVTLALREMLATIEIAQEVL